HHELECRIDDGAGLFGVEILDQVHRALDVGEEHCDRLALALEVFSGGGVCQTNLGLVVFLCGSRCRRRYERCSALPAEFGGRGVLEAARSARRFEWGAALVAKLQSFGIFGFAFRAEHLSISCLYALSSSSNALASFRSAVSKPSVNQL